MKNLFLIFANVAAMVALVSTSSSSSDEDDKYLSQFADIATALSNDLLKYQFEKNSTTSHAVSSLPLLCILAELVSHSDGPNYRKLLEVFNAECGEELDKIFASPIKVIKESVKSNIIGLKVFANKSQPITPFFDKNFAKYCRGVTENINYKKHPADYVNNWFKKQPRKLLATDAKDKMFEKDGLVYAAYTYLSDVDLNHINNPTGQEIMNFRVNKDKVIKRPGLYGNAYLKFAEVKELDAKVMEIRLRKNVAIVMLPNKPEDLLSLVKAVKNITVFKKALAAMKPTCVNLRIVVAQTHMVNDMTPYLRQRGIRLNGYDNVSKYDCNSKINSVIQEVHFIPTPIKDRDCINSPLCPNDYPGMPKVDGDRPLIYYLMSDENIPFISGIYLGNSYGGILEENMTL